MRYQDCDSIKIRRSRCVDINVKKIKIKRFAVCTIEMCSSAMEKLQVVKKRAKYVCDYGVVSDSESRIFLKYEIINVLFAAIHLQWIDGVCVRAVLRMCAMCGSCLAHFDRRCGCLFHFCFRNFNCKNNKINWETEEPTKEKKKKKHPEQ